MSPDPIGDRASDAANNPIATAPTPMGRAFEPPDAAGGQTAASGASRTTTMLMTFAALPCVRMATQCSFDVTSNVDLQEVDNALNQARKEVAQRYDFKGSKASIDFDTKESKLVLTADDEFKLNALWEIVSTRLVRRNVPVKNLSRGTRAARRQQHRPPGDRAAAGHPHRKGAGTSSSSSRTRS